MSDDPRIHAQEFLERQGAALLSGDVVATAAYCHLPCTIETLEGRIVATTEDQMREICMTFIETLRLKRVTHMVRHCHTADFRPDGTLWAVYETRYVREGNLLTEHPYQGMTVLVPHRADWKIASMQFAAHGDNPASVTLRDWSLRAMGSAG